MTTLNNTSQICQHCGAVNTVTVIGSTNQLESPDLDLRPGIMMRWTMPYWMQECSECGYVADDLANKPKNKYEPEFYKHIDLMNLDSEAKKFYKRYLIDKEDENYSDSFRNGLIAAWVCDDTNPSEAKHIRKKILEIANESIEEEEDKNTALLRLVDVARRAEEFDLALTFLSTMKEPFPLMKRIADFQQKLIDGKDTSCYKISDTKPKEE